MSDKPSEWNIVASLNNDLPLRHKMVNGKKVWLTREESNKLYATWAKNEAEKEAAKLDPTNYPLTNIQFHAMVDFLEMDGPIRTVIAAMPKGMERSMALKRYENSVTYDRDDPLVAAIAASDEVALSDAELDAAWMEAKDL